MSAPSCSGMTCKDPRYCADNGECCRLVQGDEASAAPVMSITEELVAELETEAVEDYCIGIDAVVIRSLLAERAELKRRADQGDWLIEYMASEREDLDDTLMEGCSDNRPHVLRSIIDAAMQAAQ